MRHISPSAPTAPAPADRTPHARPSRRVVLGGATAATTAALGALAGATAPQAQAAAARNVSLYRCQGAALSGGTHTGTAYAGGYQTLARPAGRTTYTDPYASRTTRTYDYAYWTTGWATPGFAFTQLVASWRAFTPSGSWISYWVQGLTTSGATTAWFSMGRWSQMTSGSPTRMSVNGQGDAFASIATDTLKARTGYSFKSFRIRVYLYRPTGTTGTPRLASAAAMTSSVPTGSAVSVPVSPVGVGRGIDLAVSTYSQMNHVGHYPSWNGGGEAWCSATSLAMVLDYWKVGASTTESSWVRPTPHTNPQVDHTVSQVFDYAYDGSGNWPFNTAYAATRGLDAFVTRLRTLTEAEQFIRAGIPLVVSTSFTSSQLTGAGFGTNGHLMVIRGFDSAGNVIVNDPASAMKASNALVRKVYNRAQFENAWARSGGTTYVLRAWSRALPAAPAQRNW
ncbi:peptidase C39 family protein [Arsenicicoccus piscis]|uniref:Membrane protein n=1 Tax=Arsenicicoccus piscis TaxID=673954 RepID=A0ABQ6HRV4_9MICO|nr:peptidase C39 family protein [Arsenicicoccus piscis]MCH8629377.1 peptidase C39 family protein [Arsenicicoccus piscis]GMA20444.1 membrane protein [Arsenicicoccus piscis]